MNRRRFQRGPVSVYLEPYDLWIGAYIANDAIYICLLPCIVIRIARQPRQRRCTAQTPTGTRCHQPVHTELATRCRLHTGRYTPQ